MSPEQQTVLLIKGAISELPADQKEACNKLAEQLRQMIGDTPGMLAFALVGAELQLSTK